MRRSKHVPLLGQVWLLGTLGAFLVVIGHQHFGGESEAHHWALLLLASVLPLILASGPLLKSALLNHRLNQDLRHGAGAVGSTTGPDRAGGPRPASHVAPSSLKGGAELHLAPAVTHPLGLASAAGLQALALRAEPRALSSASSTTQRSAQHAAASVALKLADRPSEGLPSWLRAMVLEGSRAAQAAPSVARPPSPAAAQDLGHVPLTELEAAQERTRSARELHDAVSQTLFASNLLAAALAREPAADDTVRGQAQVLERLNRSALAEMRLMLYELQPEALLGVRMPELLQCVVDALVGRGGVEVSTDVNDIWPLPATDRIEVFRIARAALSNVARHSGARHVQVQWRAPKDGPALLRVCDDGCGFDWQPSKAGLPASGGMATMRSRALLISAELQIRSAPSEGTELTLTLNRRENPK